MSRLKKKIIQLFLFVIVLLYIITALIDGVFEIYLRKFPDWSTEFTLIGLFNIVISLLVLALTTYFFWKRVNMYFDKEMKERMDQQNLMYSSIAHDLKTPMTSVLGYSAALKDKKISSDKLEITYALIHSKTLEMNLLLNDVFEYSKLSVEFYQPEMVLTDISSLVTECVIDIYDKIEEHSIELKMDIDEGVKRKVSVNEMRRVINNLLLNAINHNPQGIQLGVGLIPHKQGFELYIADSGVSLSEDEKMRLFDPFVKLDASRKTGMGSGLGLAIVDRIVREHQGSISIIDDYLRFTKAFIVRIPDVEHKENGKKPSVLN